jgi:hypothetical protein
VLSIPEVKESDELELAVVDAILTKLPPALAVSKPLALELNLIASPAAGVTFILLNFNLLRAIILLSHTFL